LAFFPKDLLQLAQDSSYSLKVGLISRVTRLRLYVRTTMTQKSRYMMTYLLLLANLVVDEDIDGIMMFLNDDDDMDLFLRTRKYLLESLSSNNVSCGDVKSPSSISIYGQSVDNNFDKINAFTLQNRSLDFGDMKKQNRLFIICEPDNIYCADSSSANVLEAVQGICLHASLRSVPVVLINPNLVATSWNDYRAQTPMLLTDFQDVYIIRDDYLRLNRKNRWCGLIYRYTVGMELFVLDDHVVDQSRYTSCSSGSFVRIISIKDGEDVDIHAVMRTTLMMYFPRFINSRLAKEHMNPGTGERSEIESSVEDENIVDDNFDANSRIDCKLNARYSWRNIKPRP